MTNARGTIPQFANISSRSRSWPRSVALELALENRAIGRHIAELRERAHLTQPAAADKAGVSLRGYQKWEGGESRPNWANLEKLADVFGVKPEEIVGSVSPQEEPRAEQLDRIEEKLDEILKRLDAPLEQPREDDADLERSRDAAERIEREEQQQTEDAAPPRTVRRAQKR